MLSLLKTPYMVVGHRDDTSMTMTRSPPWRSWLVFVLITLAGLYCAYESRSWNLGPIYFACGVMLGYVSMDKWEEVKLDKAKNKVTMVNRTLLDILFNLQPSRCVASTLSEIVDVRVDSELLRYAGTTYNVVLVYDTGYSLGLTGNGTYGNKDVQDVLAKDLYKWLNLAERHKILEKLNATIAEKIARDGPPPGSADVDIGPAAKSGAKGDAGARTKRRKK